MLCAVDLPWGVALSGFAFDLDFDLDLDPEVEALFGLAFSGFVFAA